MRPDVTDPAKLDYAPRRLRQRRFTLWASPLRDFAVILLMVLAIVGGVTLVGFLLLRMWIPNLFPDFKEGMVHKTVDGTKKEVKDELKMYVTEARFMTPGS